MFSRAAEQVGSDRTVARRLRNYRAMHLLNQGKPKEALAELDKPLPKAVLDSEAESAPQSLTIDAVTANSLNADAQLGQQLGAEAEELLPAEKAEILDAQALQLRGTSLRLTGDVPGATNALRSADAKLQSVRGGKVASIIWMRAQIVGDLAAIAEEQHNMAEGDRLYQVHGEHGAGLDHDLQRIEQDGQQAPAERIVAAVSKAGHAAPMERSHCGAFMASCEREPAYPAGPAPSLLHSAKNIRYGFPQLSHPDGEDEHRAGRDAGRVRAPAMAGVNLESIRGHARVL